MQLNAILEVAIGLVFIWLVLSIAALEIQNVISAALDWRANRLARSIYGMLKDERFVALFYAHPLIMELAPKELNGETKKDQHGAFKLPEQIPSATFAKVACELMLNAGKDQPLPDSLSLDGMKASVKELLQKNPNLGQVNQYLMPRIDNAADTVETVLTRYRQNAAEWFDNVMTQASSAYKLNAQKWSLIIGFVVALTLNIDTLQVAQDLWRDPAQRAIIVAQAQAAAEQNQPPENAFAAAQNLNFPIGWTTTRLDTTACTALDMIDWRLVFKSAGECRAVTSLPAFNNVWGWLVKIFGYLLSAVFAAQGAPFWFDILRKLVGARQATAPKEDRAA